MSAFPQSLDYRCVQNTQPVLLLSILCLRDCTGSVVAGRVLAGLTWDCLLWVRAGSSRALDWCSAFPLGIAHQPPLDHHGSRPLSPCCDK